MDKQKRNTKTKQLVFDVLESSNSALCQEEIGNRLAGKIDRVTIYRILNSFCDEGKVHKIADNNGKMYFALCHHCSEDEHRDNHIHFKCLTCGGVTCMEQAVDVPTLPEGYAFSSLLFTVSGYCPDCLKSENDNASK
jgi:Fe2+ or Zn2+ uptake regulation protein